ncbi:MAG: hypothetical protein DRJ59_04035 [Thermoprotei archaeon]|nr:MAG: hypothetical protein DRJ59_04035 [Thermoprotei archaeon]
MLVVTSYHARTLLDIYGIPPGQNAFLEDSVLDLSECSCLFKERECRCPANIHALDKRTFHRDRVDPREDPIGHLIHDCKEEVVAFAGGFSISYIVKKRFWFSVIVGLLIVLGVYILKRLMNKPIPVRVKESRRA